MSVWYLDLDDEITDAVARLRAAQDDKVVLVLPAGSRIGTGRINFRLLAREAESRGLTLALVSGDAQTRALAASAGLGTHATIADAERSMGMEVDEDTEPTGARSTTTMSATGAVRVSTAVAANADAATAAATGGSGGGRGLLHRGRGYAVAPRTATAAADGAVTVAPLPGEGARVVRRGPTTRQRAASWGMRGGVLAVLVAGGLYVAYLTVPTATVTLTPGSTQLEPQTVAIVASANAAVPDPQNGIVPAVRHQVPLYAADTFEATGTVDNLTFAEGFVRFTSKNTLTPVLIRSGVRVSTQDGREYKVMQQGSIDKWSGDPPRPWVELPVRAVRKGPGGNTAADTVTVVPDSLKSFAITATNPDPITGGDRTPVLKVTQKDCDNAREALYATLRAQLEAEAALPGEAGTRYPASADLGSPQLEPTCAQLKNQQVPTFELSARSTGTVLEVDTSALAPAAVDAFRLNQDPGVQLEQDSIHATPDGNPKVKADKITFPMAVTARATRLFDPEEVRRRIAGKPVDEAKKILSEYGEAILVMWPDFVPSVPTDANRITLEIPQQ